MAAGDVEVRIVNAIVADLDTALTAMRVTAGSNGKYFAVSIGTQNEQIVLFAITEA